MAPLEFDSFSHFIPFKAIHDALLCWMVQIPGEGAVSVPDPIESLAFLLRRAPTSRELHGGF